MGQRIFMIFVVSIIMLSSIAKLIFEGFSLKILIVLIVSVLIGVIYLIIPKPTAIKREKKED